MDIIIQREALLKPLQAVSSVVEKKQTLPILANVLLTVKEGKLAISGTDMEIELIAFAVVDTISAEGIITVSARKLFDICRNLPEEAMLRLSVETNYLMVRAGESCFMLNTLAADGFPQLDDSAYSVQLKLRQVNIKHLLAKTYFAMGQQDVRHYLNGVFLEIASGVIKCVAADGHRLALATIHDENIQSVEAKVILPRKSVLELMRLLNQDNDSDMDLFISDHRFRVVTTDYIFTSKLINAQYPDYTRLIPKGNIAATGDREAIKQALVRASILSNEKFRGIRFQIEPAILRITANNADQEQADEVIAWDYEGQAMEMGFNVAYLLDVLSTITTKSIRYIFTGPNDGVLIESIDPDHSLYVVMPMRL